MSEDERMTIKLRRCARDGRALAAGDLNSIPEEGGQFAGCKFVDLALPGVELRRANFAGATFIRVNFHGADLSYSSFEELNWLPSGIGPVDFGGANLMLSSFWRAYLTSANFADASLINCDLSQAKLSSANLSGANFENVRFYGTVLRDADMRGASFAGAVFDHADLRGARIDRADFRSAIFRRTRIDLVQSCVDARLSATQCFEAGVSLSASKGLVTRGALIADVRSWSAWLDETTANKLVPVGEGHSVMISYGGPDEPFARRLCDWLEARHFRTYFFKKHALPGQRMHALMRDAVNNHDKIILICSRDGLARPGLSTAL